MSPSRPFIERPVATSLLMLAIVLAGLLGFRFLPLSALPEVDYPTIQVQTLYPGASPEVMSRTVSAPLERQFGQMSGLERMASSSAAGVSIITLQFSLGLAIDVAEQEVQAAINAGASLLPADLPVPPVYAKVNPADAPVLTLAISSQTLPLTEVQNLGNTRLAQKISQVTGVGLVTLAGGHRPAVRIQADTKVLASYGIGLDTLRIAITSANANSAKGSFDGPQRAYTINANDQLVTVDDYRNLIVAWRNGAPVRLTEVARVVDAPENNRLGAWAGRVGATEPPPGRPKAASAPSGGSEDTPVPSVGATSSPPPGRPKAASAPRPDEARAPAPSGGSEDTPVPSVGAISSPPPGLPKAASAPRPDEARAPAPSGGSEDTPVPSVGVRILRAYKISKRFDDDISAVCLVINLDIEGGTVSRASIGAGGVAATPARARQTEAALTGQAWTTETVARAALVLQGEFTPISDMRASGDYRRAVLASMLQRFWLESQGEAVVSVEDFRLQEAV